LHADPQKSALRFVGRNDRIIVDRYADPARRCGELLRFAGRDGRGFRIARTCDRSEPVLDRLPRNQAGNAHGKIPDNEVVFGEKMNALPKEVRVSRLCDREKDMLVYLVWPISGVGTKGSAFNCVTAVPSHPN
jgi:hypothetical protein